MGGLVFCALALVSVFGMSETPQSAPRAGTVPGSPARVDKVILSEDQWKSRLTPEQYRILRNAGTEAAFCSPMLDNKEIGTYHCVGCDLPLFVTENKFKSGTGWPSFFQPATKDAVWTRVDRSYGMIRDEVLCSRCDGHLGHVFEDGPKPTGLRYCINGEVLVFKKAKQNG